MTVEAASPKAPWAGFWRRLLAFLIDQVILGAIGTAIVFSAYDPITDLGLNGRWIGLAVATLYYGIFNSAIGRGRTPGKVAMGLRVVKAKGGGLMGAPRALGRGLVLELPLILNGYYFQSSDTLAAQVLGSALLVGVFGITLANIFLYLFAGPERRLVHDLLFGTVAVLADAEPVTLKFPFARATIALVLALAPIPVLGMARHWVSEAVGQTTQKEDAELTKVFNAVSAMPEVSTASVADNTTTSTENGKSVTTRALAVTARLRRAAQSDQRETPRIARIVIANYRFAPGQGLEIRLEHSVDIGIFRLSHTSSDTKTPQEWAAAH